MNKQRIKNILGCLIFFAILLVFPFLLLYFLLFDLDGLLGKMELLGKEIDALMGGDL